MLWGCWLIYFNQKIKTGLSVSLRLVPRENGLASMFMLASVSHFLRILRFWPFFWYVTQMLSLRLACSSDHRRLGLAHGIVCRSDSKVCGDRLHCVSNREVQRSTLQSQPLAAVIFTMIERVITLPAGEKNHPCVVHCISSGGAPCDEWQHVI